MGLGLGPNSVTHRKPVPTSTRDLHIHGGSIASGKDYIVTANISYILSYRFTFMIFKVYYVLSIGKATQPAGKRVSSVVEHVMHRLG